MILEDTAGYVAGFSKGRNFRDLGGQVGEDGRKVKHGFFYRGSAPGDFTESERKRVLELGVRMILDFRSLEEEEKNPNPCFDGIKQRRISVLTDTEGNEINFSPKMIPDMLRGSKGGEDFEVFQKFFLELYISMAFGNPAYKELFKRILEGDVPIFFHCSAGKDRTGVAAMLLLLALGVSEDDILKEYLLTNEYRKGVRDLGAERFIEEHPDYPEEIKAVLKHANGVREEYARPVLAAIKDKYSSREDFFVKEYGLGKAQLEKLWELYLE